MAGCGAGAVGDEQPAPQCHAAFGGELDILSLHFTLLSVARSLTWHNIHDGPPDTGGTGRIDPGIGGDRIRLRWWRRRPMRSVITCGPARAGAARRCRAGGRLAATGCGLAPRGIGDCWPASAPTTTCDSSRAATSNPSAQVLDALARVAAAGRQGDRVSAPAGQSAGPSAITRAVDAADGVDGADRSVCDAGDRGQPMPGRAGGELAGPRACHRVSPPARTSCAGGCWSLPPASCTWIGTKRPTSR